MLRNVVLQCLHLRLHGRVSRVERQQAAEFAEDAHQSLVHFFLLLRRAARVLFLKFAISLGVAPRFLCAAGVLLLFFPVKCLKAHGFPSPVPDVFRQTDHAVQPVSAHFQKLNLRIQHVFAVGRRVIQNRPDRRQRKIQLPEEKNRPKPLQCLAVIQAVARLRHPRGTQQPDGVVVVQRANADAGQLAHFLHGLHARILPSRRRKDKAFRSVRVNRNFKT